MVRNKADQPRRVWHIRCRGESVSKSVGPWLFFFPANQLGPGSPPMLIRTTGQVTLLNHADGTQTFIQKGGTSTDMCPLLA